MKNYCVIVLAVLLGCSLEARNQNEEGRTLRLVQKIPLTKVKGRIDHMTADVKGKRLFIAALGNNTVEVIDLEKGQDVGSIAGLKEPQGVLFVPEFNKLVVTNAGDGSCRIFDGETFRLIRSIDFKADADNVRYDQNAKRVYVGYGNGGLGIIDAKKWEQAGNVKLAGHPESFQLETNGKRIFVNSPSAGRVTVVDRQTGEQTATWKVEGLRLNFPMALDENHHRVFVGYRWPGRMVAIDTETGKMVTQVNISGDVDDIFYDSAMKRVYLSCGEGAIDVFDQVDADHYKLIEKIKTAAGARTSFFVQELKRFYVAVPRHGNREAELWVYATETK